MQGMREIRVALLFVMSAALTGSGADYYRENFRRYSAQVPGVVRDNGATVANDPIWVDRGEIRFKPERSGYLFDEFQAGALPAGVTSYDLCFTYRLMQQSRGAFDLVLRDVAESELRLTFAADEVVVQRPEGALRGALPPEVQQEGFRFVTVKVADGAIAVHSDRHRVYQEIVAGPVKLAALKGFNFYASTNVSFGVTDIVLRDPAPLTTWPVEQHFAAFESLKDEAGFAGARSVSEVTLTGNGDGVKFRVGDSEPELILSWSDGRSQSYPIKIGEVKITRKVPGLAGEALHDGTIQVGRLATQYVKPLLRRYHSNSKYVPALVDIIRDDALLPVASEHPFDIDLQRLPDGSLDLYFDGSFVLNQKQGAASFEKATLKFKQPTSVVVKPGLKNVNTARYVPLDLAANPRAKAFIDAKLSLPPGLQTIGAVPLNIVAPAASADVGICRQGMGDWALEVDEYTARSPLDGFSSAIHYRLPPAH